MLPVNIWKKRWNLEQKGVFKNTTLSDFIAQIMWINSDTTNNRDLLVLELHINFMQVHLQIKKLQL